MKKWCLAFTVAISTLSASPITYYALDNKTPVDSDEIFNDPFLALRTKTSGRESSYSIRDAWEHLANFSCPEWDESEECTLSEETEPTCCSTIRVVNKETLFDHTSPHFEIAADAVSPEKIYWQISDSPLFERVVPNFDEIQAYTRKIEIPTISQTFLTPDETYYFRAKVCGENGWSDWSEAFAFQVIKPKQPQEVACTQAEPGRYVISWKADSDPTVRYIVCGGEVPAFIPAVYGERSENILAETEECDLIVDDTYSYYRVIAVKNGCCSVPSELVIAEDFSSLMEELNPSFTKPVTGYAYNRHVKREVWDKLTPYFLPSRHPLRYRLDKIFKGSKRVLESTSTLKKAGFKHPKARQWTRLIVTSHKKMPGYIIKLYTDSQHPHRGRPEWTFWKKRIEGVTLIQQMINERKLNGLFKTPKKWIYPVPHESSPKKGRYRKNFILVEQDMDILSDPENEAMWRSPVVTARKLNLLFDILQGLGLWDCAKPANIPFGRDGRIAFIDTQTYRTWPVKHYRLTPFLSPPMQKHWNELIKTTK